MACSLFMASLRNKGEHYCCSLFAHSLCYVFSFMVCHVLIFSLCSVSIFSLCSVSIFSLCSVSIFSLCSVSLFSLCYVSIFSLCYVWCLDASRSSLRSLAAASRPQAISPNIIVFIVHGLTFIDVGALDHRSALYLSLSLSPSPTHNTCEDLI